MGKLKHDSDDDMGMDIELPIQTTKKNKLISKKARPENTTRSSTSSTKTGNSIVRKFAKSVNLKNKFKPLDQKQDIFNKVVDSLKDKTGISKKNKKKIRVQMKKQLRMKLDQERVHNRKKSTDAQDGDKNNHQIFTQNKNPQKFKKKEINQRQKASQFHKLMGSGLQNIRGMIANSTFGKKTKQ